MEEENQKLNNINSLRNIFLNNYSMVTLEDIQKNYKNMTYLSWAKAWRMLVEQDPNAEYEILSNDNGFIWEQLGTLIVRTKVRAFGKERSMWLSIMDNDHNAVKIESYKIQTKNGEKTIDALNSNMLNNALMRCLTKNIAMFGIGLALYEGEDVPKESESASEITKNKIESKKSPVEKLTDLCKAKLEVVEREKIIEVLKKYEPNGNTKKMNDQDALKAIKEINKLKGEE